MYIRPITKQEIDNALIKHFFLGTLYKMFKREASLSVAIKDNDGTAS